ncbi:TraR/DksA C4-type zinc finger protein [Patescibacteria group bacterium]|jgi:RNA polymerase-binding transcription factor DksA|nr:TraR/DksA C4-type zinc finger protein [Patescibacteria group bacterium]
MTPENLELFKQQLAEEQQRIEQDLATFTHKHHEKGEDEYAANFPDFGTSTDENASEVETYSEEVPVEHSLNVRLQEVRAALERIKNNTYGMCIICGKEISRERLLADPAAKTCMSCADSEEK